LTTYLSAAAVRTIKSPLVFVKAGVFNLEMIANKSRPKKVIDGRYAETAIT